MWFVRFVSSSIGKKLVMALTGLMLLLFLVSHAAGNATIYMSRAVFQSYADELHSHPLIVIVFSSGLLLVFLVHICLGLWLFLQNRKVQQSRYTVTTRVVDNPLASKTMPYTGLFILLFLLIHVYGFAIGHPETELISDTVKRLLGHFFYGLFYIAAFAALALHLSHGFWSMLQTFGANHPRYNELIGKLTLIIPVFFLLLFGGIALYFMTGIGNSF
jgi:succinate dehydrogenase / fumarate reductase, cytochrome b subunit